MKSDKRKEKLKLLVLKKKTENYQNYSELPFANSENSGKTKTIVAAWRVILEKEKREEKKIMCIYLYLSRREIT